MSVVRLLSIACAFTFFSGIAIAETHITWDELPPLPEPRSGHFAGVHNGALIVAGGSNFLVSPWQGGEKQWYTDIFVLPAEDGEWIHAGELPEARAYGVSIADESGLYLIGGGDGDSHYASTVQLSWNGDSLSVKENALPALPIPTSFTAGARVKDIIHLIGGQESPSSTSARADTAAGSHR